MQAGALGQYRTVPLGIDGNSLRQKLTGEKFGQGFVPKRFRPLFAGGPAEELG
jgi:hypothetical protein